MPDHTTRDRDDRGRTIRPNTRPDTRLHTDRERFARERITNVLREHSRRTASETPPPTREIEEITDRVLTVAGFLRKDQLGRVSSAERTTALTRLQNFHGLETTGIIDAATATLLATSRCSLPDVSPAAVSSDAPFASTGCGWNTPIIRYAFGSGTNQFSGNTERDIARRALRTLSRSGAPTFIEVDPDDSGLQMKLSWTDADCGDEDMTGTILAHADYPPDCPYYDAALPQPIHMDDEEHTWIDGGTGGYDAESVILHEAGHIIGLYHSGVDEAVMKSTSDQDTEKRVLHSDDLSGIGTLYRGRSHVHLRESNGTVGPRTQTNVWTAGWTNVETFTVGNTSFLMLLKHSTGDVHIHQLNGNGTVGTRVLDTKWTPWWTTTRFYEVGGETYLFLLKERGTGADGNNVHIHRMNDDGTVGDSVQTAKWTEGWTTAEFYEVGGETYLFLLKERGTGADGNNVHIHRVNDDGTVGDTVQTAKWTEGWTTARFVEVAGSTYLLLLKERGAGGDGNNVHIHRMDTDGTVGASTQTAKWTEGWTTAEFYGSGGNIRLFLMKVAGTGGDGNNVHIHQWNPDGTVGVSLQTTNWTEGWTSMKPFRAGGSNGFILVKSCDPRP